MAFSFGLAPGPTLGGACHAWDFCSLFFWPLCSRLLLSAARHGILFASLFFSNLVFSTIALPAVSAFLDAAECILLFVYFWMSISFAAGLSFLLPFIRMEHSRLAHKATAVFFSLAKPVCTFFLLTPSGVGDFGSSLQPCMQLCGGEGANQKVPSF